MGSFTPPPTTSLSPGDRLDRYELLCVLAQGGMGTVWLARMTGKLGFERLVALKTILPSFTNDRQFCDMFLDEARIAALIEHENVGRIFEIGEDRGFLYYAMELVDGESVRKLYRDVRAAGAAFPMPVALRIIADASAGLHATHEVRGQDGRPLDVVHRDVSPQNLLITVRGTTKLIDFGVAKANARTTEATAAGTLKGKIEYMAPEQARGEPLDRRADVYALGAVLYELLAGRPPLAADEGRALAALHSLMTGVPHTPLPDYVPEAVRVVVHRALAQNAAERFATADALRLALEQAMLATGLVATTDDVAAVLTRFSGERSHKRREAIDRAVRAADEGRLQTETLVAPLSSRRGHTSPQSNPSSFPIVPIPRPSDSAPTGPSMRTMQGASLTSPPPASAVAKVFIGSVVLGVVAAVGVVTGIAVTRRGAPTSATAAPVAPLSAEGGALSAPAQSASGGAWTTEPASPATGVAPPPALTAAGAGAAKDGGAARPARTAGAPARGPARTGPKPTGDGDEYGF